MNYKRYFLLCITFVLHMGSAHATSEFDLLVDQPIPAIFQKGPFKDLSIDMKVWCTKSKDSDGLRLAELKFSSESINGPTMFEINRSRRGFDYSRWGWVENDYFASGKYATFSHYKQVYQRRNDPIARELVMSLAETGVAIWRAALADFVVRGALRVPNKKAVADCLLEDSEWGGFSPKAKLQSSPIVSNLMPHKEIEKRLGMSLNQARNHQEVKLANGWQFYFVVTKGKRSSDDEYDAVFHFFLFDEHGAFRSSKSFTKPKHILETDGGRIAYKLNAKSFAALSVRDWVIELQEAYDIEAPDEIDGAAATYFSSYSNVFLVSIDQVSSEMTLALDSLQTSLVAGLVKPSSSSSVFWDKEERLQRILVPQKGEDFPNLLLRVRQCTSSRSKTSCADTSGYKKWKNEAIYSYRDRKYEKQPKKGE